MALARHQFTVTDEAGNVQASASIRVIDEATGALAALYSDRAGGSALGNPFAADPEGFAAFHVLGGSYKIVATKGSFSQTWRYVGIGTAAEFDSDIFINANRTTVRAATTANITIATALNNGDTLDGLTLATNDRVLVKNQTTKSQNGIYVVGATPARASDFATFDPHAGAIVVVQEGTANALKMFFGAVNSGGDIDTDDIIFAQIAAVAGPPGADGESFHVDANGSFAERSGFDDEAEGFAYLSNDGDGDTIATSVIFIMGAGGSGDWSDPIPFQGPKGDSAYVYIAYASDDSGTGFTNTFDAGLAYIAIKETTAPIASPVVGDFAGLWTKYKGSDGSDGSDGDDGAKWFGGTADPDNGSGADGDFYIQVGNGSTGVIGDVWTKAAGSWSITGNIRGASGAGTGDVVGPAGAIDAHFAQFDGATGLLLKDGGLALDTSTSLSSNSDSKVPSQKAVKAYVDALLAANDVVVLKGAIDCSANPNYPAADAGHFYKISVAGKIGGASGVNVEAGDSLYCITDSSASGNQATVGANWVVVQVNIDGALVGVSTSADGEIVLFNGTGGKATKRATGSGMAKLASGVLGVAVAGTDYMAPTTVREVLTANRTYYVDDTNGNDSNDGLAAGSGRAFKTIQKAINVVAMLDLAFNVTISIADSTAYGSFVCPGAWIGTGTVSLVGNTTTPANVRVTGSGTDACAAKLGAKITLSGMELRTTTSGNGIFATDAGTKVAIGSAMRFGACATYHMRADANASIDYNSSNYSIVGAATCHAVAINGGLIQLAGGMVTITGTPAFSSSFLLAQSTGLISIFSVTWSGSATGSRYAVSGNAVINTFGSGTASTYFPGNSNGTTATGGQQL